MSQDNGGCVEVADLGASVAVRDSQTLSQAPLVIDRAAWDAFLADARTGRYDVG
jgi:hypothetical protein